MGYPSSSQVVVGDRNVMELSGLYVTLLPLSLAILKDEEGKTWNTHGGNEKCIQNRYMWTSTEEQGGQKNIVRCDMVSERKTPKDKCILSLWIPRFFPPCCILVESADFLQSYLLLKIKICWDVTSCWMANGYRRFEDRSIFIFQGQAVSSGTTWPCR